nr:MAG TPA: hypothetical protein [Caudoviricetes sp.]
MHEGMKIIDKEEAAELFDNGEAVYLLYDDDTEALVWEKAEIYLHNGECGIEEA